VLESYEILLVLALGMVAYALFTLVRGWRVTRAARSAWYSIESLRMRNRGINWGMQAVVLFAVGAGLLIWIALSLQEPAPTELSPSPTFTPWPTPGSAVTSPTTEISATTTLTVPATVQSPRTRADDEAEGQTLVPIPTPALGSQAVVTNTGGGGLWMRDAPYGNGLVLLAEGASVSVLGGLVEVDGLLWQSVADVEGREGWVAADYLSYR
jgi:hypothetical protein